jgi:uncharacterized protein (TIGR03435 family)
MRMSLRNSGPARLGLGSLAASGVVMVIGALMLSAAVRAQSTPRYDIVSIKPHAPADRTGELPHFLLSGEFKSVNVPLLGVIAFAYDVPLRGPQLSGGPAWLRTPESVFDIDAKSDSSAVTGISGDERTRRLRGMLQGLLAEHFGLKLNRELREQPVYLLTVAKNGPKLEPSKLRTQDCDADSAQCHTGGAGQGRGIHEKATTLQQLVIDVAGFADHPLLDRTGIKGLYDIDTDGWVPMLPRPPRPPGTEPTAEDLAFADPARPTLYQIFDRLGLKMERSRAAADVITIESIEKPAGN